MGMDKHEGNIRAEVAALAERLSNACDRLDRAYAIVSSLEDSVHALELKQLEQHMEIKALLKTKKVIGTRTWAVVKAFIVAILGAMGAAIGARAMGFYK